MSTNNRSSTSLSGVFGVAAVACYVTGAVVELPLPDGISLLIFFGFPAFGIVAWYLLRDVLSTENSSTVGDLALIFAAAGFTLLTAMVMVQMAARIGIAGLQLEATSDTKASDLALILKGVRFVDFGLDVAWDFLIGTAFLLTGGGMRRVPGLGLPWGLPLAILGALLIALNAWTFPWPPDTRGLFDIGPFCALYMMILSVRLIFLGRRGRTA